MTTGLLSLEVARSCVFVWRLSCGLIAYYRTFTTTFSKVGLYFLEPHKIGDGVWRDRLEAR